MKKLIKLISFFPVLLAISIGLCSCDSIPTSNNGSGDSGKSTINGNVVDGSDVAGIIDFCSLNFSAARIVRVVIDSLSPSMLVTDLPNPSDVNIQLRRQFDKRVF